MISPDPSVANARRALSLIEDPPADDGAAVDRFARIVWCHLIEPGDAAAGRVIAVAGAADALRMLLTETPLPGLGPEEHRAALKRWRPRLSALTVTDTLTVASARRIALVTPGSPLWPHRLDDLEVHAPVCLWVRGEVGRLSVVPHSAAIVGARAATRYGEHVAMELAGDLAATGIAVVSGGAYGIDGAAHRAALSTGGYTIALLAGGVERAYPAGHASLIDDIAARGIVLSEVPCGSAPTKWRFLQRNRLIAALSDATVVVEAGWRSGSLNTAGHAAALSRPLGAVPGPITSAASVGCHRLLREYGAQCITSAADVREMLGILSGGGRALTEGHTDDSTRVRDALSTRAWREAHDVARRAGMAIEDVEALLGLLHLEGHAERSPRGWRATVA